MNKQRILFFWSNAYAFKNMEYLINHLSKKYLIDAYLILDNPKEVDNISLYCLRNSSIDTFNVIYIKNYDPNFDKKIKKEFNKLNDYKFCISGDEAQVYSKYFLHHVLGNNTKKIIFWIHTSYIIQNLQNQSAKKNLEKFKSNFYKKSYKFMVLVVDLFKNLRPNLFYIKLKIIINKIFIFVKKAIFDKISITNFNKKVELYKLQKNYLDQISEVGGGKLSCYLFTDKQDVDLFNKYAKKNISFQTKHHLSYYDSRKNLIKNKESNTLYLPLSLYDQSNIHINKFNKYYEYIEKICKTFNLNKLVFRKHPRDNDILLNYTLDKVKNKYEVILESSSSPVQDNVYKYQYCLSTVSAVIKDIRALNTDIKIILIEEFSKFIFKYPKQFFEKRENIHWIDDKFNISEEFIVNSNYSNECIKEINYFLK